MCICLCICPCVCLCVCCVGVSVRFCVRATRLSHKVCRVSLSVCVPRPFISFSVFLRFSLAVPLSRWPTLVLPIGPTISTKVGVNDLHRCPNDTKVRPTAQPPQWQHSLGIQCLHSRCVQTWRATGSATQFRCVFNFWQTLVACMFKFPELLRARGADDRRVQGRPAAVLDDALYAEEPHGPEIFRRRRCVLFLERLQAHGAFYSLNLCNRASCHCRSVSAATCLLSCLCRVHVPLPRAQ